jgi:nucleotide-binding universal stress UspA family protein/membrane protein YdbS with pleckstrin-like domain
VLEVLPPDQLEAAAPPDVTAPVASEPTPEPPIDELRLHRLLVAVDGSANSELALSAAVTAARRDHASITLLTVVPSTATETGRWSGLAAPPVTQEELDDEACKLLRRVSDRIPEDIPVRTLVRRGRPGPGIVAAAREGDYDAILLGARGVGRVGALLGSVSHYVLHHADIAVFVTHAARAANEDRPMDLHPGEEVVYAEHPSWRSLLLFYLTGLAVVAVGVVIGAVASGAGIAVAAGVVLALVVLLVGWLRRIGTRYLITNERLHIRRGILARATQETRVTRVQNVNTQQSIGARILRIGTVEFDTAGTDDAEFRFVGVGNPDRVVRAVDRAQRIAQHDDALS